MKTIEEMIAVMTAYKKGKEIEGRSAYNTDGWASASKPSWDWLHFDYRVKPEPKYRPYANAEEFLKAQNEHGMYIHFASNAAYKLVTGVYRESIAVLWDSKQVEEIEYADLFKRATWQDGSPCGVLEG